MTVEEISSYLREYNGRPLTFMEVCGSHTAAIAKFGIKEILSDKIRLISGPGCPVCVTPSAYIDRLIALAKEPDTCVVTFGDMLRVPGSTQSLSEAKGEGAKVAMVYSPMDMLPLAKEHPEITYVFAAVGFETTAPVYTLLLEEAIREEMKNIRLLTALKTMPKAIEWLLTEGAKLDGFLAPGHVCAVTGSSYFDELAARYQIPFAVSGFGDVELLTAIYGLVRMAEQGENTVKNFYPSVVERQGNTIAGEKMKTFFEPCDAVWRGMGMIPGSGLCLREEYKQFDAGSAGLIVDKKRNLGCCCGKILMGRMEPKDCPLFGKACTPGNPQGACMVSYEGSCYQHFTNG
ncbi:MAG: hydrogenase formation protein HypD [Roseburia sp.]|nr:hydrogenase formation protein HypD [Roseburia sp.]